MFHGGVSVGSHHNMVNAGVTQNSVPPMRRKQFLNVTKVALLVLCT